MAWTNPRILKNTTVALAWQTGGFGVPASSAGAAVRAQCFESEIRRGAHYIDPQGTTGSEFPRDTHTEIAAQPSAHLRLYAGSRLLLAALLEASTHGQSKSIQASGDLSIAGDTNNAISALVLTGVRPGFHSDTAAIIYATLATSVLSLYSDAARTQLVAQGSGIGAVTLAAQGSSGLSGTVTLSSFAGTENTITITIARVRPQRAAQIARWFTLFRDSGSELETLGDCAVKSFKLVSQENGPLMVEVEIVAATYAIAATALSPQLAAYEAQFFSHAKTALTVNAIAQSVLSLTHGIEHDVDQADANATTPVAIWSRSSKLLPIAIALRASDESRVLRDDGVAGTWRAIVATYTYGSKQLVLTYARCKAVQPDLAATRERDWADHTLTFEARDDGTNPPVAITLDI